MSFHNYNGPNCAGAVKTAIPDFLNHTANAKANNALHPDPDAPSADPGPNAKKVKGNTKNQKLSS